MGFFSDLKEDLSQAVNELMPDEELLKTGEELTEGQTETQTEGVAAGVAESLSEPLAAAGVAESLTEPFAAAGGVAESLTEPFAAAGGTAESLTESFKTEETAEPNTVQTQTEEWTAAGRREGQPWEQPQSEEQETEISIDELLGNIGGFGMPEAAPAAEPVGQEDNKGAGIEDAEMEKMLDEMLAEEEQPQEQQEENKGAEEKMETETSRVAVDETSVITAGMTVTGDIVTEGSMEIVGTINGNVDALGKLNITGHVNGNSKAAEIYAEGAKINGEVVSEGAVKIGASSVIIGNITATSAAIAGAVKGDIDVKGPVVLDASAIVMGNIKSKSVQINNGAVIEGMCSQCYADVNPSSFFEEYKPEIRKPKNK
jgi:cytoskeletal protein CcmA (bactofilin family)